MKLFRALLALAIIGVLVFGASAALAQATITSVEIIDITETSATIIWSTEEPGDSVVYYGANRDFGFMVSDPSLVSTHAVILTDLIPNTRYFLRVQSTNADGDTITDDRPGNAFTFKTLKPGVVRKTFVGTVIDNATSASAHINSTSTVTIIQQGNEEPLTIRLPDTYVLKTPGGPRAGMFETGARVVIRAMQSVGEWVAESVLVKPVKPSVPVTGVVVGLDESTMTVMRQDGSTQMFELADGASRPSKGEVLTVFIGPPSRANGVVRMGDVNERLQRFVESIIDDEGEPGMQQTDHLGQLLVDHTARQIEIIDEVLAQAPDESRADISKARERVESASEAARAALKRVRSKSGRDTGNGIGSDGNKGNSEQSPGQGTRPDSPPGLSGGEDDEDGEKGNTDPNPGVGLGHNFNDDDRGGNGQNPDSGPGPPVGDGEKQKEKGKGKDKGEKGGSPNQDSIKPYADSVDAGPAEEDTS